MSKIKRYEQEQIKDIATLAESENGMYVRYTDHLVALAYKEKEIERLRERVAELEQELKISERNNRLCLRKIEQLKEQGE